MASTALGQIGYAFEPTSAPGEQIGTPPGGSTDVSILSYGNVAASVSATNQPTGSTGMRLHIYVYNNTATGTLTVAGTDINGNSITETTPTIPIAPVQPQSQETGRFDYVTQKVYKTINSSGITTSGLTGGSIKIGGIYGAKAMLPGTLKAVAKYGEYSPDEQRALGDRHTHKVQTIKDVSVDIDIAMYPETSLFIPYALTSQSTPTSTPSSATTLKTTTAVSGSPLSLTTQPTAPGQYLIMVITGTSTSGTIALTGSNDLGASTTETITASGNGTYYSANKYSAIASGGVVITGLTSGSIAITGVFAWNRTFQPTFTPYTLALEWFTGSESMTIPFFAMEGVEFDFDVKKEFTAKIKGIAQERMPIGDRTTLGLSTSRVSTLIQPVDRPIASWQCNVYIDPGTSGAWGVTSFGDMMTGKVKISNAIEGVHTLANQQTFTQLGRGKWTVEFEAKLIYTNLLQIEQFRQDTKQYIQLSFLGRNVGSGNIQQIQFVIPFKYNKFEVTSTAAMKYPEVDIAGIGEYDPTLGSSYQIQVLNSAQNPAYTS